MRTALYTAILECVSTSHVTTMRDNLKRELLAEIEAETKAGKAGRAATPARAAA